MLFCARETIPHKFFCKCNFSQSINLMEAVVQLFNQIIISQKLNRFCVLITKLLPFDTIDTKQRNHSISQNQY